MSETESWRQLAEQIRENRTHITEGRSIVIDNVNLSKANQREVERLIMTTGQQAERIDEIRINNVAQTEALKTLTASAIFTREDISQSRKEHKESLDGFTSRILDEMSNKRKDDTKTTLKILGIMGAMVTAITGLATWYVTGQMPEKPVEQPTHWEAQP